MRTKKQNISEFELSSEARAGVFVINMSDKQVKGHNISNPHRDDHWQVMLATGGEFTLNIDFEQVQFAGPALLFVLPEQVHQMVSVKDPKGWIINFDPSLFDKELLEMIGGRIITSQTKEFYEQAGDFLSLTEKIQSANRNGFTSKTLQACLNAFLNLVAGELNGSPLLQKEKQGRAAVIVNEFKQLLKKNYKTWKQPAQYASAISISTAHLNDTVKAATGISVSDHIQQVSILEAKRLLYFTDKQVKEIAYETGYDEPVYFGKLFKKITNLTPLGFRNKFRD